MSYRTRRIGRPHPRNPHCPKNCNFLRFDCSSRFSTIDLRSWTRATQAGYPTRPLPVPADYTFAVSSTEVSEFGMSRQLRAIRAKSQRPHPRARTSRPTFPPVTSRTTTAEITSVVPCTAHLTTRASPTIDKHALAVDRVRICAGCTERPDELGARRIVGQPHSKGSMIEGCFLVALRFAHHRATV